MSPREVLACTAATCFHPSGHKLTKAQARRRHGPVSASLDRAGVQRLALRLATVASTTDSCSRRGGKRRIPGLRYSAKDFVVTPAMAWVARAESAATAPQLARCLRALDSAVQVHVESARPHDHPARDTLQQLVWNPMLPVSAREGTRLCSVLDNARLLHCAILLRSKFVAEQFPAALARP